ncbi:MAG: DUF1648 domain-containing protein [Myxococcota bacterium]
MGGRWKSVRVPLGVTIGIVVLVVWRVASVWSSLPDTVASHFAASGEPNGFMSRAGFFWVMGLVGGGTIALLFAAPMFLRKLPTHMINVPNRDYWLATDARRIEALDRLASYLGWMAMATAALLAVAIELAVEANVHRTGFASGPFLVCLGAYFVVVLAGTIIKMRVLAEPPQETPEESSP